MKKQISSIIWGAVLIAVGVLLMLSAFGVVDFDLFFDGWWTLFIIIPCLAGIVTENDKGGYVIGLVIGVLLLLSAQDVISFDMLWQIFVPAVVIVIGLGLILKNGFGIDMKKRGFEVEMRGKIKAKRGKKK